MRKYILLITSALFISQFSFSKENAKPIIIDQLQRFSLAEQMPMSNNYDVRMRKIVVASGAKIPNMAIRIELEWFM
jgi:hypothetical protein